MMMNVKDFQNVGKCLTFESTTGDPAIGVKQDRSRAAHFDKVIVRMKTSVTENDMMQFFWKTEGQSDFSEASSVRLPVRPSSDFVEYVLPLKDVPGWKWRVTDLRLDPVATAGVKVEIEHIRLEPR